jgi:hypothetical protein
LRKDEQDRSTTVGQLDDRGGDDADLEAFPLWGLDTNAAFEEIPGAIGNVNALISPRPRLAKFLFEKFLEEFDSDVRH